MTLLSLSDFSFLQNFISLDHILKHKKRQRERRKKKRAVMKVRHLTLLRNSGLSLNSNALKPEA